MSETSAAGGVYLLGVILVAVGTAAIGLSYRDLATAIGLALAIPGALLIVGAVYAKRREGA